MSSLDLEDGARDLVPLIHEPVQPARESHPERVFLTMWQRLMSDPERVQEVYYGLPHDLDQRGATAGASLVCWLGTNVGSGFLHQCQQLENQGGIYADGAYLMAWAIHNRRKYASGRLRTIEHLLTPGGASLGPGSYAGGNVNWPAIIDADINLRDQDAIECVLEWLATARGKQFIRAANKAAEGERDIRNLIEKAAA